MKYYKLGIAFFGIIEILIGAITLSSVGMSLFFGESTKPIEVLIFVLVTSLISFSLGIGIFKRSLVSYHLLIFFAAVIILSKILIFSKIISLTGALETTIPASLKNVISIIYHSLLILYFGQKQVRQDFGERRSIVSFFKK